MKFFFKLIGAIFKLFFYGIIVFFCFFMVLGVIVSLLDNDKPEEVEPITEENSEFVYISDSTDVNDTIGKKFAKHTRLWRDYSHNLYTGEYQIAEKDVIQSQTHRENIPNDFGPGTAFEAFYRRNLELYNTERNLFNWTWTYETILSHDKDKLFSMYEMFDSIYAQQQPNRQEFADIIVSHIQFLPYLLVHPKTCEAYVAYDTACVDFRCQYHRDNKPCLPEIDYGILTPLEYAYGLEGDCDTRTVLLMMILDHYGYDTKMLYSYNYGHAVLGVSLPATGFHVYSEGKKYYLWETTNRDWMIGQIGASYQNMDYWDPLDIRY